MIEYRKAAEADIALLTDLRVTVLIAANLLPDGTGMEEVRRNTYDYYARALTDGSHTAYIALDGGRIAGTGAVCYYTVMPTYHNPSGKKAYIMNMYTAPEYRRRGIAAGILGLLTKDAKQRGVTHISLEATAAGRPLYEKAGFVSMTDEMELPEQKEN